MPFFSRTLHFLAPVRQWTECLQPRTLYVDFDPHFHCKSHHDVFWRLVLSPGDSLARRVTGEGALFTCLESEKGAFWCGECCGVLTYCITYY